MGHLPNGTMVVVNDAAHKINQTVEVELLRYIQTSAGRMIFATLLSQSDSRKPSSQNPNPENLLPDYQISH